MRKRNVNNIIARRVDGLDPRRVVLGVKRARLNRRAGAHLVEKRLYIGVSAHVVKKLFPVHHVRHREELYLLCVHFIEPQLAIRVGEKYAHRLLLKYLSFCS